ncbi:hypothetical protein [Flavitalea sp.]|nr:hypothetical protein [Flavitalea sp.]
MTQGSSFGVGTYHGKGELAAGAGSRTGFYGLVRLRLFVDSLHFVFV